MGQPKLNRVLKLLFAFLRKHQWLPWATTLLSSIVLAIVLTGHLHTLWGILGAVSLICSSFVWGYTVRSLRETIDWPPLTHWQRQQYAEVWDSLAASMNDAAMAATGWTTEATLRTSGTDTVNNLLELAGINPHQDVFEIGCGVGRIGKEIATHSRSWTGADISANMLAHASERLKNLQNTRFICLKNVGLSGISDNSFDVVYATNMLAHLDEMDRWRYVEEAYRVLRPGGRLFIDNMDLESDAGWSMFAKDAIRYPRTR